MLSKNIMHITILKSHSIVIFESFRFKFAPKSPPTMAAGSINNSIDKLYAESPGEIAEAVTVDSCEKNMTNMELTAASLMSIENMIQIIATLIGPPPIPKNEEMAPIKTPASIVMIRLFTR